MKKIILKTTALLISVYIVVGFILSSMFVAIHIHHDHTGAECVVCQQIEECEKILHRAFLSISLPVLAALFFSYFVSELLPQKSTRQIAVTLISLKVELLN